MIELVRGDRQRCAALHRRGVPLGNEPCSVKGGCGGPKAKGPDFWCAFEDGEVTVIGDEPGNTDSDPDPSEKAVS
jgi:hypothetical protein